MPHGLTVVPRRSPGGNPYNANILITLALTANSRFLTKCYLQKAEKWPSNRRFVAANAHSLRENAAFHGFPGEACPAFLRFRVDDI